MYSIQLYHKIQVKDSFFTEIPITFSEYKLQFTFGVDLDKHPILLYDNPEQIWICDFYSVE